jgi:hypothetical protein
MNVSRLVRFRIALALCLAAPAVSHAQSPAAGVTTATADSASFTANEPAATSKIGKTLHAFRITTAPKIDGTFDDEVWGHAQSAGELVQWDPDNGEPATERTLMQVAYDDRFVYVAIRCLDRTPAEIARGLGRRDDSPPTDFVSLGFDPRHDHQTGYFFQTNPSGVQSD